MCYKSNVDLSIKKIREYQPDIVLCNAVKDPHIDDPKGSNLVSDACFLSGVTLSNATDCHYRLGRFAAG